MKTIRQNAKTILLENYKASNSSLSFIEYVEIEASNDPNFFRWLFDEEFDDDFDSSLSNEQREEYKNFLTSL